MPCQSDWRQSFLIRLWAEPDEARQAAVRGFIQDVATGHRTYFHNLDLPLGLIRESALRLSAHNQRRVLS
jgi:hypothetical protein